MADRARISLLGLGYGLLLTVLIFTTPFGGSPDELDHYLRALSVGQGELVGAPTGESTELPTSKVCCEPGNASALAWVHRGNRFVRVPERLDPITLPCRMVLRQIRYDCGAERDDASTKKLTTMGTIEPTAYVLAGLTARAAPSPIVAVRLQRVVTAALALALFLLAAATALVGGGENRWPLVGLATAATPVALYTWASPSPNALEISGALAFGGASIVALRSERSSRLVWITMGCGAAALGAARSLGPIWLTLVALLAASAVGWARAWHNAKRNRVRVGAVAVVCVVAGGSTVLWEALRQPHVSLDSRFFWNQVHPSISQIPALTREWVGVVSPELLPLPRVAYLCAFVGLASLVVASLRSDLRRSAITLSLGLVALIAITVVVSAAVLRQNGFALQGRHVFVAFLALPVLAGFLVHDKPSLRGPFVACAVMSCAVAVIGVLSVLGAFDSQGAGAHVSAIGSRALPSVLWQRPGWSAVTLVGGLLVLSGLLTSGGANERA